MVDLFGCENVKTRCQVGASKGKPGKRRDPVPDPLVTREMETEIALGSIP